MNEDALIDALRHRILIPSLRVDKKWDVPPLYAPAEEETIANAESTLGFSLPPLLLRLYHEVANGGFGPAGGMIGLHGGHVDSEGLHLVQIYETLREAGLPKALLPLWDWGAPAWSCIDTRSAEGRIVTQDADGSTLTTFTLRSWLEEWLAGADLYKKIYELEPLFITNPFTKKTVETTRQVRPIGVRIVFPGDAPE